MLLSPFYAATVRRESFSVCLIFFIRVSIAIYLVDKTTYRNFQVPRTRGTQREYSSKPLKHSIGKRVLVFKR